MTDSDSDTKPLYMMRHARTGMFVSGKNTPKGMVPVWTYSLPDATVFDDADLAVQATSKFFPMTNPKDYDLQLVKSSGHAESIALPKNALAAAVVNFTRR